jgi:hypothetical protein
MEAFLSVEKRESFSGKKLDVGRAPLVRSVLLSDLV